MSRTQMAAVVLAVLAGLITKPGVALAALVALVTIALLGVGLVAAHLRGMRRLERAHLR